LIEILSQEGLSGLEEYNVDLVCRDRYIDESKIYQKESNRGNYEGTINQHKVLFIQT